jgi:hypothetical protein
MVNDLQVIPKTLLFGTGASHPVCRCHKPRSKPTYLLNVFAAKVVASIGPQRRIR